MKTWMTILTTSLCSIAAQTQAGLAVSPPIEYSLGPGSGNLIALQPTSTHVCFFSGYVGNSGGGRVYANSKAGYWYLERFLGYSSDPMVYAKCVALAATDRIRFYPAQPLVSPNFTVARVGSECRPSGSVRMWDGDSIAILQGIDGPLDSFGDSASVRQGSAPSPYGFPSPNPSVLSASGCYTQAFANSVDLFETREVVLSPGYEISATSPNVYTEPVSVRMTRANSSMCYFTKIGGEFGAFSRVTMNIVDGYWTLEAKIEYFYGDMYNGAVYARARCVVDAV
jgi:hypothetical protein